MKNKILQRSHSAFHLRTSWAKSEYDASKKKITNSIHKLRGQLDQQFYGPPRQPIGPVIVNTASSFNKNFGVFLRKP